jgi:hydrogenase maturation factor
LLVAAVVTAPVEAHHSITAVYDSRQQVTVTGSVREFQFVNPHPWIGLDVTGEGGRVQTWRLELDNRFELVNVGMRADTFKPGDVVVATGSAGRDGARSLYVRRLDRPADGLRYEQAGSSPRLRLPPP